MVFNSTMASIGTECREAPKNIFLVMEDSKCDYTGRLAKLNCVFKMGDMLYLDHT